MYSPELQKRKKLAPTNFLPQKISTKKWPKNDLKLPIIAQKWPKIAQNPMICIYKYFILIWMSVSGDSRAGGNKKYRMSDEHFQFLEEDEQRLYEQLTDEQVDEYRQIFDIFDSDGSGAIQEEEIMQVMKALGQVPTLEEVEEMVKMIDVDGDGEVEFEEFLILMVKQLKKEMNAEEELVEVFNMFDIDGDG